MAEREKPGVLYGIQPYMFEQESDPDDEETPAEETQIVFKVKIAAASFINQTKM